MAEQCTKDASAAVEPPVPDSRLRLGLETTLLAWIRTGLALMAFGFVLTRFSLLLVELEQLGHIRHQQIQVSLWSGIVLIGLGVAINVAAAVMHYPYLVRARRRETDLPPTWWLGLVLAGLLAVVGITMVVILLFMNAV
jgi:putative membrane protein